MSDDRAQAHTLEAFVAALLLVSGLMFAAQATAVTPLSASTSNQHIENQHRSLATDVLSTTADDGSLREAAVYWQWNETTREGGFNDTHVNRTYYTSTPPEDNPISPALDVLDENHLAYNVDIVYRDGEGGTDEVRMVEMGTPSDNAVAASRSVTLYKSTEVSGGENEGETLDELEDAAFYAEDVDPDGQLYNVVEVRIVVWRL